MTAPWSPSRAREAARAALCRLLAAPSDPRGAPGLVRELRALLADDGAFVSVEALRAGVRRHDIASPEVLRLLSEASP